MSDKILSGAASDVITVRTERIKRKTRNYHGSGLPGTDAVVIVSDPLEKILDYLFISADG